MIQAFDQVHEERYEKIKTNILNAVTREEVFEVWSLYHEEIKLMKHKENLLHRHLEVVFHDVLTGIEMLEKGKGNV
tara:strand:+ start:1090 stop:1317 length:228 start_codon:yes stop_codon:yes gene_type:complete